MFFFPQELISLNLVPGISTRIILECEELSKNTSVEYEDIFGDENQQVQAVRLFSKVFETKSIIEDKERTHQLIINKPAFFPIFTRVNSWSIALICSKFQYETNVHIYGINII